MKRRRQTIRQKAENLGFLCFAVGVLLFGEQTHADEVVTSAKRLTIPQDERLTTVLSVSAVAGDIIIYGDSPHGKPRVVIHPDGKININGDVDRAALAFWEAVSRLYPTSCRGSP